jgi:diguanylate cyclase (GGDEF)-like protein/PAS domain S-box-containing protein
MSQDPARPLDAAPVAAAELGGAPIEPAHVDRVLAALVELEPSPYVYALSPVGLVVPLPEQVPVTPEQVLTEHHSALDLITPNDMNAVLVAWETCLSRGSGVATAHSAADPTREITLHFLDARARFGVFLGLVTGLQGRSRLTARPRAAMGPRVVYLRKDPRAVVLGVDEAFTLLLGWTADELVGRRALEIVHPEDQTRAIANWMGMLQTPDDRVRVRLRHQHRDGHWVWFEVTNYHRLADPRHGDILGEMIEIAEEMGAEEALRARTRLLQRLTETLPMGVAQIDLSRQIVYRNLRLDTILGASADRLDEQLAALADTSRSDALAAVDRALTGNVDVDLEVELATSHDRCAVLVRPLRDDDGTVTGAVLTVNDITESVRLRDQLERRATYDELTGSRNRAAVLGELEARLTGWHRGGGIAVVFVDLDHFKAVNDGHGHAAGDRLLIETCNRLLGAVRGGDVVGRIGGDEFLVVASDVPGPAQAMEVAERLSRALHAEHDGVGLGTTASVGVAWTDQAVAADALVAAADAAMYAAKGVHDGQPVLGGLEAATALSR